MGLAPSQIPQPARREDDGVARQIADALEAAHEKGIIHRHLKPSNIKITPEGVVKILDFGLAKMAQGSACTDPEASPTLTIQGTVAGLILGTAAYMAPKQACGKRVDKRADIWSFGVVLWEMLTGRRLFHGGETVSHTLAGVLRDEVDFARLPPEGAEAQQPEHRVVFLENFLDELRRRVPMNK